VLCDRVLIGSRSRFLCVLCALPSQLSLVLAVLGGLRCTVRTADFGDRKDGLPALEDGGVVAGGCGVAEAGGGEGTFRPPVVDAGEMPVDSFGRGVAVQLVTDVDKMLDTRDVYVVDAAEIEDYRFQRGSVRFNGGGLAAAGTGIVPRSVLREH